MMKLEIQQTSREKKKSDLPLMFMMLMCLFSGAAKKFPPVLQYIGDMWLHVPALSLLDLSILLESQKKDKFTTMRNPSSSIAYSRCKILRNV